VSYKFLYVSYIHLYPHFRFPYGRYERNEVKPTIEMAVKIVQALEVSLDYLTGNSDIELDKNTLDRVQEVTKLSDKDKEYIFVTLDALIRDFKNKQAYSK
jgi:transcriptional regulator with XRE-family HTH domain